MVVYFSVATIIAILTFLGLDRRLDKHILVAFAIFGFFILLVGLRWGTTDFYNYYNHFFRALDAERMSDTFSMFRDIGHGILLYALTRIFTEPVYYFLFYAAIAIGAMFFVFKKTSPFFLFSVFIYVTNGSFHQDVAQMRQGLTASLVLLALYFLYQQRKVVWFLLVSSSASLQFSSTPAYLTYFAKFFKSSSLLYFLLFLALLLSVLGGGGRPLIALFESTILAIIGEHHFGRLLFFLDDEVKGLSLRYINFGFLFSVLFVVCSSRLQQVSSIVTLFIPVHVLGTFVGVAFQDLGIISSRVSDTLTYGVEPVLWAAFIRSFKGYDQIMVYFGVLSFFLLKYSSTVLSSAFEYSFVFLQ